MQKCTTAEMQLKMYVEGNGFFGSNDSSPDKEIVFESGHAAKTEHRGESEGDVDHVRHTSQCERSARCGYSIE